MRNFCHSGKLKTSSKHLTKMPWRCLEDVFARGLEDVLKTFWIRLGKTSWRRMTKTNILVLIKVLKTSSEDVWVRRICSSWSRHLEDVFKTSSRGLHQDECLLGLFYSELCWRFWNLGVANFLRKTLLLLVKTDFLASRS